MQPVRQAMDSARQFVRVAERPRQHRLPITMSSLSQQLEIDGEYRDLLAHVIVKLACKFRTFRVLRGQHARGKAADFLVTGLQLLLTSPEVPLRLLPSPSMQEEAANQHGLRQKDRRRAQNVTPIAIPGLRLSKSDHCTGGNPRLADAPPLELTPIEIRHETGCGDGNVLCAFAGKNPRRQSAEELAG